MDESFNVDILDESIEEVKTMHKCDICQYESVYKQNLTRHIKALHAITTEPGPSSADSWGNDDSNESIQNDIFITFY